MRMLCFSLCTALSIAPTVLASTVYNANASQTFSYTSTATYNVTSSGNGLTSQGFVGSATSTDPATLSFVLNFGALAGENISSASLDLYRTLPLPEAIATTRTLSADLNGGHTVGTDPAFSSTSAGLFVTITGALSGTKSINLTGITNYDLMTSFLQDLQAGNSLTLTLSLSNTFSAPTAASGNWKNETATYALSQKVSGTFYAAASVTYDSPTEPPTPTPEPTTVLISGGGLMLVSLAGKKFRRS